MNETRLPEHAVGRGGEKREKETNSRRTQNTPPKPHSSSTTTGANSRRRTTKQVPRISPSSPASLDAGFLEVGHVQLSQSTVLRKNADRPTQRTDFLNSNYYQYSCGGTLVVPVDRLWRRYYTHTPTYSPHITIFFHCPISLRGYGRWMVWVYRG